MGGYRFRVNLCSAGPNLYCCWYIEGNAGEIKSTALFVLHLRCVYVVPGADLQKWLGGPESSWQAVSEPLAPSI